jgi:hypothetical protein
MNQLESDLLKPLGTESEDSEVTIVEDKIDPKEYLVQTICESLENEPERWSFSESQIATYNRTFSLRYVASSISVQPFYRTGVTFNSSQGKRILPLLMEAKRFYLKDQEIKETKNILYIFGKTLP